MKENVCFDGESSKLYKNSHQTDWQEKENYSQNGTFCALTHDLDDCAVLNEYHSCSSISDQ